MSYQALYRKFRPTEFSDVKGQEHIVTTLLNQIKANRIGHAYLFCGTRGTGKTTVAKILAKAVNCEHPVDGSPCGECESCKAIAAGNSMNVIEIDAASNNGVDNIREIREEVQYSPTTGKYKVYIIDEVHMLSIGAFNALLKTLEEPPAYVIFILATTEAVKIPITILSRCQRYDFHRISIETIADRLSELMKKEGISVEDRAIRYVAKAADGSMRDALSLLDQCIAFYLGKELKYENVLDVLGAVDTQIYEQLLGYIVTADTGACMELVEHIIMQGKDIIQFVNDFVWYLRNLLLVKTTDDAKKLEEVIDVSEDNLKQLAITAKLLDADTLMRYIRIMSELANDLKTATQKRIKLEVALIKLAKPAMENKEDISEILSRVTMLEKQLEDAVKKIKEGVVVSADLAAGTQEIVAKKDDEANATRVEKRKIEAVPSDIAQVARSWNTIVSTIENGLMKTLLSGSHITLGVDGQTLEIAPKNPASAVFLNQEDNISMLEQLVEERVGFRVALSVLTIRDENDFKNKYEDLRDIININIEVDDEEEFI